ncbi:putative U2 small nuclear ribonucleoprotein 40K [Leptomonas pyrrhocoris]|uniref:Putative U2 small nuclear ribonucleoprotein 40K n=1 Tax=Leptomonas pyrrhocoris TaxID=157538 RepID=A0A0M9G7V3_LEPPY|nr:putative U2 small nuclear ribonucleoprotein 40K [Leptomonas pyrrhocoris]KPA84500.1 putative U2 small nuclear ribonucleoprotein 40K [Leptomonas pyrrhocoris]|eukprot:XP_015662939.1 putative U2 small nuclear ribonucleoprotein 40K [Leptomonas pyrrhocoris]
MRLSIDLVRRAPQFTNTLLQREIDLRGLRISSLDEHVLVLLDNSFDVVNLSSNALTALEYFPTKSTGGGKSVTMDRVTSLIAHRNDIQRVSVASCVLALPNVRHFVADRNRFSAVQDLSFLKQWKKLEVLSLEENPVWAENSINYDDAKLRAFLLFLCPHLKLINYQRVTKADRECLQENKKEFKELMASWEASPFRSAAAATSSAVTMDGKKLRKRGREGRAAAAAAGVLNPPETVVASALAVEAAADGAGAAAGDGDDDDALQARLDQLEERLLADDVTTEEIAQLEEEMTEISTKMAAARKRKRH